MSSRSPLTQLLLLDTASPTFQDQVSNILYGEEYTRWMSGLQGEDLMRLVDFLDKALDALKADSPAFRKCLRELRNLCGPKMILPTSYTVSSQLSDVSPHPIASGGSADVHEGTLNDLKVCVKRVRIYSHKDSRMDPERTFYQEAVVWKRLKHQNIVPFLGITTNPFQLISEWMPGGVLTDYVRGNPNADRRSLVSDVAGGLYYLHSRNIVHGDLKGPNILVDATGHARITDFGLTTVTKNLDSIRSATEGHGNAARWTAPEILRENGTFSKEADIFSFAMVMIEGFTGAVPFSDRVPAAAIVAIMNGKRPPRPIDPSFTRELWTLMQRCWHQDPHSRPEVSEVFKALHGSDPPPIPQGFQVDDSDLINMGIDPYDGSENAPRLDLPNTGDGTLSGYPTNDAPHLGSANQPRTDVSEMPPKDQDIPLPQPHQEVDHEKKGKEGQGVEKEAKEAREELDRKNGQRERGSISSRTSPQEKRRSRRMGLFCCF